MWNVVTRAVLLTIIFSGAVTSAPASFIETFDTYVDTAAMKEVWVGGLGELDSANGQPGQSMFHPGATVSIREFGPLVATEDEPLIWEVDIFDDNVPDPLVLPAKAMTAGLRNNGMGAELTRILEIGMWNDNSTIDQTKYNYRAIFGPGAPNWVNIEDSVRSEGWHHFRMVITPTEVRASVDGGAETISTYDSANIGYNAFRIGGPSNSNSPGGGANFDNAAIAVSDPLSPGDVNGDGIVNNDDYAILRDNLFTGISRTQGDLDSDGDVDLDDFSILKAHFNQGAAQAPEPSTLVLLAVGLAGYFVLRRRSAR